MKSDVPHLLLIEEDELLADITAFRLELLGYAVHCVRSGKDAQEVLTQESLPNLLIVDTTLPDMNGLELIGKLNAAERTHNIPLMALSEEADLDSVQRAYRAGAMDYLVIPYDPAVLEQKVGKLLEKSAKAEKDREKEKEKELKSKKVVVPA